MESYVSRLVPQIFHVSAITQKIFEAASSFFDTTVAITEVELIRFSNFEHQNLWWLSVQN